MGCRRRIEGSCWSLFLGLFVALSLSLTGCRNDEGPAVCQAGAKACTADSDCGGGSCQNNCCTAPSAVPCQSDADCDTSAGQHCAGGTCEAMGARCTSNNDCANGDNKICDSASGACVACLSNVDCATDNTKVCSAAHTCVENPGGCSSDSNCVGSSSGPHCNRLSRTCVECVSNNHCIGVDVCANGKCQPPVQSGCTSDTQCSGATPKCNATSGKCVACTDDAQCGSGKKCDLASNACVLAGCQGDGDCAGNAAAPRCNTSTHVCVACLGATDCNDPTLTCSSDDTCVPVQAQGCTSDAGCTAPTKFCIAATHQCVECKATSDCASGKDCANNKCVAHQPTGCQSDQACQTNTSAKKCSIDSATGNGTCVQCLAGGDCTSGLCDGATHTCQTGCASDSNCQAPLAKCNTGTHACVACLGDGDCTGSAGQVCVQNSCQAGCTSNAQCTGTTPKCNTTARQCVACLADADCGTGKRCDQNQCVAVQTGGVDQPCGANDSCDTGSVCLTQGTTKICRKQCDPYNPGTSCAATNVCAWVGFTSAGQPGGACLPKNGRGAAGAACQAESDCELDLLCLPTSATASKCTRLCNPSGATGTCASGTSCHALPAYYDGAHSQIDEVGACLASTSTYGQPCASDFSSSGADCGSGMTCGPNPLLADDSIRVSYCQYPFGTGQADQACTDGAACITGDCLGGPKVCNTTCHWTSDCTRAGLSSSYKCLPYYWIAQDAFQNVNLSETGACQPTCKSDAGCAADRTCMLTPTFENSGAYSSSFYGVCYYKLGATSGPNKKAGQRCTQDTECASGTCVTNGASGTTDGYCFGTCDTSATGQCDSANGVVCDPSGVGLKLNDGADGRAGTADDAYGRAYVCGGKRCQSDRDCTGASADSTKPRSCQLTLQVNGSNNQYGSTTQLRTTCEPSVGAKKGGTTCAADADCQSGSCLLFGNGKKACFGACSQATDCATGSTCSSVNFGTSSSPNTIQACAPN